MIEWILVSFAIGVVAGTLIGLRMRDPDLTTDICAKYLTEQGYTVHLRTNFK